MPLNSQEPQLYDVVAVEIGGGNKVRFMGESLTLPNAEAIVKMAVMRRGVEDEFFCEVPAGLYKEGERWEGRTKQNLQDTPEQKAADLLVDLQEHEAEQAQTFDEFMQEEPGHAL